MIEILRYRYGLRLKGKTSLQPRPYSATAVLTWFFLRLALNEARREVLSRVTGTGNGDRGDIIYKNIKKDNISMLNLSVVQWLVYFYVYCGFDF